MKYERYHYQLIASGDTFEFRFTSLGPKGSFEKIVHFHTSLDPNVYNLGFGDVLELDGIDDEVRNDNQDRNKVLATVAATLREFLDLCPDKTVAFYGSTPARTRLYRMAITVNYEELSDDFIIQGIRAASVDTESEFFIKGSDYSCFLIRKKPV